MTKINKWMLNMLRQYWVNRFESASCRVREAEIMVRDAEHEIEKIEKLIKNIEAFEKLN
jgi:hypothetical protein